jgi:hypothetical protein
MTKQRIVFTEPAKNEIELSKRSAYQKKEGKRNGIENNFLN